MVVGGGGDDGWIRVMVAARRDGCRWWGCRWLGMRDGSYQCLSVVVVSGGGYETKRNRNTTPKVVRRRGREGNLGLPLVLP
ncbi:hypothetical protein WN944_000926 [Citrus x changshan-huyou]|uniref:Uncharacterized protein n=1 Tax=Citrus x changshan-huyou TaxID=2935761 RepID=A0AAP0MFG4_9ROSI